MNAGHQKSAELTILGCMHACGGWELPQLSLLPCGGSLDVTTLLWPLVLGRAGVTVATCSPDECRHRPRDEGRCRAVAAPALAAARDALGRLGLSPRRVAVHPVNRSLEASAWVREQEELLAGLPRLPLFQPLPTVEDMPKFSVERLAYLYARLQAMVAAADIVATTPLAPAGDLLWLGCRPLMQAWALGASPGAGRRLWERAGQPPSSVIDGRCCGYPLWQRGEKEAFAALARGNAAFLARQQGQRLVTACPHCHDVVTRHYRKAGVELGLPVVDLLTWASEVFAHLASTPAPLSIAALPAVAGDVSRETAPLARWARQVTSLEVPSAVPTLVGPAMRRWVEGCLHQAAQQGAAALVASCPHEASRYRALLSGQGWRTGPAVPLLDRAEVLAFLLDSVASSSPRRPEGSALQESSHDQ